MAAACEPISTQFELHGAQAYDRATGLTWQRCALGQSWSDAGCDGEMPLLVGVEEARQLAADAGPGWRLPTLEELATLVVPDCQPAIHGEVFPDVEDLGDGIPYWTSSSADLPLPMNYYVDFSDGRVDAHTLGFGLAVRLVRAGRP